MTPALAAMRAESIAQLLGHGVGAGLVGRWLHERRLRGKLETLLDARLGNWTPETPLQTALLQRDEAALRRSSRRLALLWHGAAVRRIIDAPTRQRLLASVGEADYQWLLATPMDVPAPTVAPSTPVDALDLDAEGLALLAAWVQGQAEPFRRRLALLIELGEPARVDAAQVARLLESALAPVEHAS
jgi:hypothetical protein